MIRNTAAALLLMAGVLQPAAAQQAVTRQQVDDRKAVIATVEPVRELPARARIGGTIVALSVREGDQVAAGDRIALVVDPKLALQIQALESRIQAQNAAREQAQIDFNRMQQLRGSGTVSQAQLDQVRTRLDVAVRTFEALRSDREVVEQQSTEGAVLAPAAGRVLKVPVSIGSVVLAGETIATLATDNYILRLQLPERHARFMKAGDTILVGARGLQQQEQETLRRGRVRLVYPQIDQGRVIADAEVDGLGDFFVGERTRVYVATGKRDALVVPADAVYRRYGVSYVKLKDGTEVVVQLGLPVDGGVEVLSGLNEGDLLVKP
ncbi:MAG: efflux RND transporter periplasmic adaptor subunit [Reyranella sp.]|uniref:efflux RND transporter periplasmic adaptor subunit n=1 Tax=Reyranella sp. TaxID=1929291 RepID=UPI00272F2E67|nr:efflux RND transporter periplasmic adaptor subunit [Reyranella sp.]MDP1964678.1 efflux RND transporter periplasmic adaptor subunit [Reyranella sp.]MDP2373815.1 efflux RND transporter periplasmic adaptor subunit [Reyranella sp.]